MRLLILSFLFIATNSFAQNAKIVGKVTDNENKPIYGATVLYRKDITLGAHTDEDGNYLIEVPAGKAILVFRYSGMNTDTVSVDVAEGDVKQMDFQMAPVVTKMEGVEIKVGKFDRPIEEQTVSLEIIKPELIENKNTRSIESALDQTPGLNILDGEPQIRGGSGFTFGVGSKVAVIVDDMPMLSGDAGRPEWGFIPVENIHQIEVIKGASSVLSGSSALSGAIHIRTAYPKSEPLTKVNLYGGFYSKPSIEDATWWRQAPIIAGVNVLHSRMAGNWDVVLGANFNYDHGYMGPPVQDSLVDLFGKDSISNFREKQMVSKRARINFNIRRRSTKLRGLSYGINGNFMYSESPLVFAWLNDTSGLYQGYPGAVFLQNQFIFNVDPFLTFVSATEGKHFLRTRVLYANNEMTANQSNKSTTFYGDYMFQKTVPWIKGIDIIAGLTGKYTDSYANMYVGGGSPNNKFLNMSAYAQVEKKLLNVLNLSLGGRLEYFQMNDSITALKPIFRAGASIKVFQETYFRASYGQGYRFPTITERFIRTGVGNFGVFANPYLKPESSWNAEVGLKQGLKLGSIYGYIDIAGYWQEYKNTIEYLFGFWGTSFTKLSDGWGFKFLNTGRSRVVGVDASFTGKAQLGKKADMVFMIGYNYILPQTLTPDYVYATDTMITHKDYSYTSTSLDPSKKILKYRFLHNVKMDFEWTLFKKVAFGGSAKYFSKMTNMDGVIEEFENATSGPFMQSIRYMDYFKEHQHGVWIFDARISYSITTQHKIAIISANLLNKSYSLRPLKIESPRTIMLQYTFKLDKNS
ncbi:MAG: TonB-dependent receptor [Crocinitomicaceae bacterium]|nr:TonB-dependent receptor [Crocinitomicaceae bacterium]